MGVAVDASVTDSQTGICQVCNQQFQMAALIKMIKGREYVRSSQETSGKHLFFFEDPMTAYFQECTHTHTHLKGMVVDGVASQVG